MRSRCGGGTLCLETSPDGLFKSSLVHGYEWALLGMLSDEATDEMHIAYHEAGHAVLCSVLGHSYTGVQLTDPDHAEVVDLPHIPDDREFCIVRFAGEVAEGVFFGKPLSAGSLQDEMLAMSRVGDAALRRGCCSEAEVLVEQYRDQIEVVGRYLYALRYLSEAEVLAPPQVGRLHRRYTRRAA